MSFIKKHWPLWIAVFIFLLEVSLFLFFTVKETGRQLVYAMDDGYIHMSISKNLAMHGNWGLSPEVFTSASSSLLYTIILATVFKVFGVRDTLPLILNVLFSILAIVTAYKLIKSQTREHGLITLGGLLLIVLAAPLLSLCMLGMEHTIHIFLILLFLYQYRKFQSEASRLHFVFLQISLLLSVMTRVETIFLVWPLCVLLMIRKRYLSGLSLFLLSLLPTVLFGILSVARGGFFIPNPGFAKDVLLNFHIPAGILKNSGRFISNLFTYPEILVPVLITLFHFLLRSGRGFRTGGTIPDDLLNLYLCMAVFHLVGGGLGWFFRYEAYLVVIGIVVITLGLNSHIDELIRIFKQNKTIPLWVIIVFILAAPFLSRAAYAVTKTFRACKNMYEQPLQIAEFLKRYYNNSVIVVNDIGAVTFYSDADVIDIVGIATNEVNTARLEQKYDLDFLEDLVATRGAGVAIVADSWVRFIFGNIPGHWRLAGKWKIKQNIICSSDVVSFYAVNTGSFNKLKENLAAVRRDLPPGVESLPSPQGTLNSHRRQKQRDCGYAYMTHQ